MRGIGRLSRGDMCVRGIFVSTMPWESTSNVQALIVGRGVRGRILVYDLRMDLARPPSVDPDLHE